MLHTHCHQVSSLRSVKQITQFLGNYQYLVHISFIKIDHQKAIFMAKPMQHFAFAYCDIAVICISYNV